MTTPAPYSIVLEFSRAQRAGQPHAFEFTPQPYLLRTPGGGFESAEFPWTAALLADLAAARLPGQTPEAIHRLGDTLRTFLAGAGWGHHEQAIVRAAREGAKIHITVRSAAAELYALPWEFVALKSTGQLIGGVPGLLVRYEWPEAASFPDRVAASARRGRVLFAWSAAGGAVPAEQHLAALKAAFAGDPAAFDPSRDVIAHATWGKIDQALDDAARHGPPVDALHLLCHGAPLGSGYGLAFDDEAQPGSAVVVDAGRVQQLLAPHAGMVRLVVLSACDSGNAGDPGNHLGSVAQMIHRAGLQAVVASRFPLSAPGSTRFAQAFYGALARDRAPLEEAFLAARDALMRDPGQLDWASVQLYSRDADGAATFPLHLSSGTPASAATPPAPPPPVPSTSRAPWLAVGATALVIAGVSALVVALNDCDDDDPEPPLAGTTADAPPTTPVPSAPPKPDAPASTTSAPDAPAPTRPAPVEPKTSPVTPARPDSGPDPKPPKRLGACPDGVTTYLGNFLRDNPDGDDSVEVTFVVTVQGELSDKQQVADPAALARLRKADPARLIQLGGAALPCRGRLTWIP